MPHLSFEATNATLYTGYQKKDSTNASIIFDVRHLRWQTVKSRDGVDMTKWQWHVQVYDTDTYNELAEKNEKIGVMSHWEGDDERGPSCHVGAVVGKSMFQRVLLAVQAGRMPSNVSVSVEGLSYGLDPDGRDKVWDTSNDKVAFIKDISLSFPLGGVNFDESGDAILSASPVTALDLEAFRTSLQQEMKAMTKTLYGPLWLIAAVVVVVGAKLFFR